jgi:hypothetical protein
LTGYSAGNCSGNSGEVTGCSYAFSFRFSDPQPSFGKAVCGDAPVVPGGAWLGTDPSTLCCFALQN